MARLRESTPGWRIEARSKLAPMPTTPRPDIRRVGEDELPFGVVVDEAPGADTDARVFVLVHGIGMSHRYLRRLHRELAKSSMVMSVDLPGFGGTPKPEIDLDVTAMADALASLISALSPAPVVLVGHSMGAQWVVETARRRPDLVAQVVVIGPVVDDEHRTLPAQLRALALDTLREAPLANLIVFTDYVRCGIPWYLTQLRHMLAYRIEDAARDLRMPLLVIRGSKDPVAGRGWCRRLRDAAPMSAFVEVPGRPHVAQHSAPRAVASAMWSFIDSHTRRAGAV